MTFTPDFDVYVECEEEEIFSDGSTHTIGAERVYLRVSPNRVASANENPLGVPVECNDVVEESMPDGDLARRTVAYVPVEDPTSVTITRCGEYYATDGRTTWSTTDCEADKSATSTADSHVVVECKDEWTSGSGAHTHSQSRQGAVRNQTPRTARVQRGSSATDQDGGRARSGDRSRASPLICLRPNRMAHQSLIIREFRTLDSI